MQFAVSSGIITACTMGNLFKYSDKTVVFAYFFCFGLSTITLSFLISTFFSRSKTAVAVGTLSFLGFFFPYYTVNDEVVPMWVLLLCAITHRVSIEKSFMVNSFVQNNHIIQCTCNSLYMFLLTGFWRSLLLFFLLRPLL